MVGRIFAGADTGGRLNDGATGAWIFGGPERNTWHMEVNTVKDNSTNSNMSRREALQTMGRAATASVALPSLLRGAIESAETAAPLTASAGVDRIVILSGKTYLNGWAGYGDPPRRSQQV